MAVKDLIDMAGLPTTCGSVTSFGATATDDADVVRRLRAVAVAAGMVPLALGTDTAGSVRVPAALCGVVGPAECGDATSPVHRRHRG